MKLRVKSCPGCGSSRFSGACRIARQPVILNYRFPTPEAARRVKRRDIELRECEECGLIFNAAFDERVVPYDERYENRQCFSAAFQQHLGELADGLIERHSLRDGRILEVGCGKGDFLRLICERSSARGAGYDTSYEGPATRDGGAVKFYQRYVTADAISTRYDAILCRHVVEHVGPIGDFLSSLEKIARACGDPVVVIETPCFEWIAEHHAFWDVFYEHCNYFPMKTLAGLCRRAGFEIAQQRRVFGRQYQLLELRLPAKTRKFRLTAPRPRLERFCEASAAALENFGNRFGDLPHRGSWAIWGAGAKGVSLLNRLERPLPSYVIDSNSAKQGCFIPGTSVPVIAPQDPRVRDLGAIVIANPNYSREIRATLRAVGFKKRIHVL